MIRFLVAAIVYVASACGGGEGGGGSGGSGLPPDGRVVELDPTEIETLCEYTTTVLRAPRTVQCFDPDFTVALPSLDECIAFHLRLQNGFPNCGATVFDDEKCNEAQGAQTDVELCESVRFRDRILSECEPFVAPECGGFD